MTGRKFIQRRILHLYASSILLPYARRVVIFFNLHELHAICGGRGGWKSYVYVRFEITKKRLIAGRQSYNVPPKRPSIPNRMHYIINGLIQRSIESLTHRHRVRTLAVILLSRPLPFMVRFRSCNQTLVSYFHYANTDSFQILSVSSFTIQ
jgi:hypothetical protein